MKLLELLLLLLLLLPLPHRASAEEAGQDGPFSYNVRALLFGNAQDPAHSTQNPGNAFLRLERYWGGLELRPDFFLETPALNGSFKPRATASYRWWEDGVVKGKTDGRSRLFVTEWVIQPKPADRLFLSFGKEKLLWGSSFLVSPSNILFKDTEKANPKTEVEGKYMARAVYLPNQTITVTGISETERQEDAFGRTERPVRAVKVDVMSGSALISLISYIQHHERSRLGSYGQWTASDAVVLYYDGFVSKGTDALYPVRDPAAPFGAEFIQSYGDSSKLFAAVAAGGAYTFLSGETVSMELLYNGAGYGDAEANDYYRLRRNASSHFFDGGALGALSQKTLAESLNTGSPFLRRYYLMAQVQERDIRNALDVMLRYVYGLEERSGQFSTIIEWRLTSRIQFFNVNTVGVGGDDTEFTSILSKSFMAGIEAHF